jgi:hypothetical protein
MKTRITLSVDPAVHALAKRLAHARHTTVSGLFTTLVSGQEAMSFDEFAKKWAGKGVLRERPGDARYEYLKRKYLG